jgi:3-dehydroquinate synthetase
MTAAAGLGTLLGVTPEGVRGEIEALLRQYGLPASITAGQKDYAAALTKDKKSDGGQISFVILREIGRAETVKLEKAKLLDLIREAGL